MKEVDTYLISKEIQIDYGHRVPNHKSKCRNFHGHRGRIKVWFQGQIITKKGDSSEGMLMDFSDIKTILMEEIDARLDHGFIMSKNDPLLKSFEKLCKEPKLKLIIVDFIPTAENLAKYCFDLIRPRIFKTYNDSLVLKKVEFYETPSSIAIYEPVWQGRQEWIKP